MKENTLKWEAFEPMMGTWAKKIKSFFDRGGFEPIYSFLKNETRRGRKIAPLSHNVFRCFQETPYEDVKVVLMGFCPYHSFYQGTPVADGLAFSCSVTGKPQPSLTSFQEGIEQDAYKGLCLPCEKPADLKYLANQGVLLLNSSLTVEKDKAGSHQALWGEFIRHILDTLSYSGIPIVFIGKEAQRFEKYVTPLTHGHIFKIEHPSFAARIGSVWDTQGVFSKINKILEYSNGYKINWLNMPEELPF